MKIFEACVVWLLIFVLIFVPSNANISRAELYWKSKMGNITMPKVLKNSLHLGLDDGSTKIYRHLQVPHTVIGLNDPDVDYVVYILYTQPTHNKDGKIDYGNKVPQDVRVVYFTYEKLFTPGSKMKLLFNQIDNKAKFLPLQVSKSLIVVTNKLQLILNALSIDPKSFAAKYIKHTFKVCSQQGVNYEARYCATSLEDMVDFIELSSKFERDKFTVAVTLEEKDVVMEYTIQTATKLGNDDDYTILCHKLDNPYAVFLCHNIKSTDAYEVSLIRSNGDQTKAIAVCHKDTSSWNPRHLAFQLVKIEPGSKPICHFVSGDTIVWFRN